MNPLKAGRRFACAAATTGATALLALAPAAHADTVLDGVGSCSSQALSTPFAPFLDYASYFALPGGNFETGAAGWTLGGGAATVAGNEPWHVSAASDGSALSLPPGSSATSPVVCVGLDTPIARMFARRATGGLLDVSALLVESVSQDANGQPTSLPVGVVTGDSSWSPTLPLPLLASLTTALPGGQAPVQLRFTPLGSATWQIDDAYVDPYHRCC